MIITPVSLKYSILIGLMILLVGGMLFWYRAINNTGYEQSEVNSEINILLERFTNQYNLDLSKYGVIEDLEKQYSILIDPIELVFVLELNSVSNIDFANNYENNKLIKFEQNVLKDLGLDLAEYCSLNMVVKDSRGNLHHSEICGYES